MENENNKNIILNNNNNNYESDDDDLMDVIITEMEKSNIDSNLLGDNLKRPQYFDISIDDSNSDSNDDFDDDINIILPNQNKDLNNIKNNINDNNTDDNNNVNNDNNDDDIENEIEQFNKIIDNGDLYYNIITSDEIGQALDYFNQQYIQINTLKNQQLIQIDCGKFTFNISHNLNEYGRLQLSKLITWTNLVDIPIKEHSQMFKKNLRINEYHTTNLIDINSNFIQHPIQIQNKMSNKLDIYNEHLLPNNDYMLFVYVGFNQNNLKDLTLLALKFNNTTNCYECLDVYYSKVLESTINFMGLPTNDTLEDYHKYYNKYNKEQTNDMNGTNNLYNIIRKYKELTDTIYYYSNNPKSMVETLMKYSNVIPSINLLRKYFKFNNIGDILNKKFGFDKNNNLIQNKNNNSNIDGNGTNNFYLKKCKYRCSLCNSQNFIINLITYYNNFILMSASTTSSSSSSLRSISNTTMSNVSNNTSNNTINNNNSLHEIKPYSYRQPHLYKGSKNNLNNSFNSNDYNLNNNNNNNKSNKSDSFNNKYKRIKYPYNNDQQQHEYFNENERKRYRRYNDNNYNVIKHQKYNNNNKDNYSNSSNNSNNDHKKPYKHYRPYNIHDRLVNYSSNKSSRKSSVERRQSQSPDGIVHHNKKSSCKKNYYTKNYYTSNSFRQEPEQDEKNIL